MGNLHSWDDLVDKLRSAFQPYDYEQALWEEIRRRTQGSQEKLINYISVMENMFARLSDKPSEETRVQIIRRNLLPYLQTQLAIFPLRDIHELIRLGRSIEETEFRVQRFCPPSTNTRLLVEPEFAYRKQTNSNPVYSVQALNTNPSTSSVLTG
uniref:Retrotransposon gag domain-containing protein n=1 Tax=Anoplophora glabripennis TaxID=217634 RepID=V5H321_ANOGL